MKEIKTVTTWTGGGGPAEPTAERHPQCDPSKNLTIDIKQSELADDVKSNAKDGVPAPVRASETGRARNWTMPPLRLEREWRERTNSATIDNRCVEFDRRENQCCAFTMAEILLSLTIIGVVAAITLPSLTGNINERTWNTQRKALYARFSQAIALMPALNSYGTYSQETDSAGSTSITDTAAETFITNGLAKVLKINNICDNEHLEDCGLSSKITTIAGSTINLPVKTTDLNSGIAGNIGGINVYDTKAAAFETINGESVLTFYNPNCASEGAVYTGVSADGYQGVYVKHHVCANFVFDLNGNKGPNTVGKDIGVISAIYSTDSKVVMPVPTKRLSQTYEQTEAGGACADADSESRLPNIEELLALYYNATLLDSWLNSGYRWSSSVNDSQNAWAFGDTMGIKYSRPRDSKFSVQCIKR